MAEQVEDISSQPAAPEQVPNLTPKNPPKIVIFVVFVLMLSGAVFAGMKLQEKKNPPTPSSKITPSQNIPTAIPTMNPTEGWNTYSNTKEGYFIRYPQDIFTVTEENGNLILRSKGMFTETTEPLVYEILFTTLRNTTKLDILDIFNKKVCDVPTAVVSYETKSLGTHTFYSTDNCSLGRTGSLDVLVEKSSSTFIGIQLRPYDKQDIYPGQERYYKLFDQILSTFKFLGSESVSDLDKAREALRTYFSLLSNGMYAEAIKYNGNGWGVLRDWNPSVDPNDYAKLLEKGCRDNGYKCLKIKTILKEGLVSPPGFYFIVQFTNPDGTLFKRGPCCGATEETMPTKTDFEFKVRKEGDQFLVVTQPVYVP